MEKYSKRNLVLPLHSDVADFKKLLKTQHTIQNGNETLIKIKPDLGSSRRTSVQQNRIKGALSYKFMS